MRTLRLVRELGWRVLPLVPNEKRPIVRHGVNDASDDPKVVRAWFEALPDAGVGVACGNGLVVLDADTSEAVARLQKQLPVTVTAQTPRGRHYYFTTKEEIRSSAGRLGPGIDVRGEGGYVVAPPSIANGKRYKWRKSPFYIEVAELPESIAQQLRSPCGFLRAKNPVEPTKVGGPDTSRSGQDWHLAIRLFNEGKDEEHVREVLRSLSEKYAEKWDTWGPQNAERYLDLIVQKVGPIEAEIIKADLEVLRRTAEHEPLARLKLELITIDGEIINVRVAAPSTMFDALAPDIDADDLYEPDGYRLSQQLLGRCVRVVARRGRLLWLRCLNEHPQPCTLSSLR